MSRSLIAYLSALVVFVALDFVWLGFIAKDLYRNGIGHLMLATPNWTAAVLFYLIYIAGLVFFAVLPALGDGAQAGAWSRATIYAALFGFFCYATYDLTNLATLKGWPVAVVIADMAWGAFVSACAATASWFITRALAR